MGVEQHINRLIATFGDWLVGCLSKIRLGESNPGTSRLAKVVTDFVIFGLKQAWACLFAGLVLALIFGTSLIWPVLWPDPDTAPLYRYDAILLGAVIIQGVMLILGLESLREAFVIAIYHAVGTAMEVFKVSVGSWVYPEEAVLMVGGVPLFSGFMYASVGSYLARVQHIMDIRYKRYPPRWITILLAFLIYINFFSHHYIVDLRYGLFGFALLVFGRASVTFRIHHYRLWMPLPIGLMLVAFFLWVAENIGTLGGAWLYPHQMFTWSMVPLAKMGSWLLLMIISFVLVTLVVPPRETTPRKEGRKAMKASI